VFRSASLVVIVLAVAGCKPGAPGKPEVEKATLSLNQTGVGDRAARALSKLQRLNDVRFSYTRLTDAGLSAFAGHPYLDVIYVKGCAVAGSAVKALKKASPRELMVYGP
jgi:hypothetical protein